jgi:hypothetical protein
MFALATDPAAFDAFFPRVVFTKNAREVAVIAPVNGFTTSRVLFLGHTFTFHRDVTRNDVVVFLHSGHVNVITSCPSSFSSMLVHLTMFSLKRVWQWWQCT